jgi:hypothetical protein
MIIGHKENKNKRSDRNQVIAREVRAYFLIYKLQLEIIFNLKKSNTDK